MTCNLMIVLTVAALLLINVAWIAAILWCVIIGSQGGLKKSRCKDWVYTQYDDIATGSTLQRHSPSLGVTQVWDAGDRGWCDVV